MRKKNINFVEEIKNSQNFLHKLQSIKKTSNDIKEKSKLTVHRNIWVKEFKYLSRLQRDCEGELDSFLENFDHYFTYEIEERQLFKNNDFKTFTQMKNQLENNLNLYSNQLFKQIQHLPLLVQKCQQIQQSDINLSDIKAFIEDIEVLLLKNESQLEKEQNNLHNQSNNNDFVTEQLDEGYEDIVYYFKPIADQVKGFDFQKDRLRKIEEGETHLMDYLQNFEGKLTGDEISQVIEEFNHASNLLHETLQLQIEKIALDYQDALNFNHNVIKNDKTYQKFLHLYQIYIGRGKSLIQYFERLSIEFPKVSKQNIQKINDYIVAKIYKERKTKAAKRNFLREKEELFYKVEKEVNMRIEKKIKDAQKEAEKLLRREEKLKLQKELESLRADYNERQEEKKKELALIQKQKEDEQKKRDSVRRLYLDDLGKRAEEAKEIKQQQQKKIIQSQKIKKEKQEIQKKMKIINNQPKVKERQSIERKKIEKKLQIREYKGKQKQLNEDRINKAIEQYPFRPQVEFSEERLNAPTEAQIKRKEMEYDMAYKVQLTKMTGYSVNQLMSDMRFRLNTALHEAGIANTDYARQMLVQMSKKQ